MKVVFFVFFHKTAARLVSSLLPLQVLTQAGNYSVFYFELLHESHEIGNGLLLMKNTG